jgi:hypothetical protein
MSKYGNDPDILKSDKKLSVKPKIEENKNRHDATTCTMPFNTLIVDDVSCFSKQNYNNPKKIWQKDMQGSWNRNTF